MTKQMDLKQMPLGQVAEAPMPTFAQVKGAVMAAGDLSPGTRSNLLRAVDLVAKAMGSGGLGAVADVVGNGGGVVSGLFHKP